MENKTGKYLKYALGEIVLVMIGILLALSVSNWNTNRQSNQTNIKLLKKMDNELQLNIDRLNFMLEFERGSLNRKSSNDSLELILTKGFTPNDLKKIKKNFYTSSTLNLYTSTYEEMKNTGHLYNLGSDSLLNKIETYYKLCSRESYYVVQINKQVVSQTRKDINKGWWKVQQDYYTFGKEQTLKDNKWLFDKQSEEYKAFRRQINMATSYIKNIIERINKIIDASKKLQESIREEIKKNE